MKGVGEVMGRGYFGEEENCEKGFGRELMW